MSVSLETPHSQQAAESEVQELANLTEEQRTIARLQKENLLLAKAANSYLNEAEIARDQLQKFASKVSHDLKAPLRHISAYLRIIKKDFLNDSIEEGTLGYMDTVSAAAVKMGKMIDGLRELTNIKEQPIILTEVDLGKELAIASKKVKLEYPGTHIELPELPVIKSDLAMIRIIFGHLLDNAAKFSAEDNVPHITVSCQKRGIFWEITFSDNGIGFDNQDRHMLFEIFERCDTARKFQGQGIGLAIVSRLLSRLGGDISATSTINEGAQFTMRLKG